MTTLDIQRRLKQLGCNPGPLDGVRGRATIAAVKRFQSANGLTPDGLAGPKTLARLFAGRMRWHPEPARARRRSRCGPGTWKRCG